MRDKMARKLVKHELDVDAYLADGGTLNGFGACKTDHLVFSARSTPFL